MSKHVWTFQEAIDSGALAEEPGLAQEGHGCQHWGPARGSRKGGGICRAPGGLRQQCFCVLVAVELGVQGCLQGP